MNKPRAALASSAVFLSAALVVSYFQSQEPTFKATEVLTWDCESAVYKPESITLTCADGGVLIQKIEWLSWGPKGAKGSAIYLENNCQPDCASGKFSSVPVEVSLSNLIQYQSLFYLKNLVITPLKGLNLPRGQLEIKSDLSEFAK
jgi:hypothetical protein